MPKSNVVFTISPVPFLVHGSAVGRRARTEAADWAGDTLADGIVL